MLDFLLRNSSVQSAQKYIDKLQPKVELHIPSDLPLPSISVVKKFAQTVSQVKALEETLSKLSDQQLRAKTEEFKEKYQVAINEKKDRLKQAVENYQKALQPEEKESLNIDRENIEKEFVAAKKTILDEILPEAFAVVREASKRTLRMRHFDVQILGGMVLHNGDIAEMTTGEGKTLVATLPAYLNALTGEGVHVVTVNDYLAKRDREWMGPVYEFLGLVVGVIQHDMGPAERQHAYNCDITYGTNNEFGFDYLRDNMVSFKEEMVQRKHNFAIVDEVDSILVDEARTPLIISGPAEESTDKYYRAFNISKQLKGKRVVDMEKEKIEAKYRDESFESLTKGYDYVADEKAKAVSLTEEGEEKAAKMFGVETLHDMETIEYRHHILQSLKAKEFFFIDVDYVVRDGEVIIVDEFTGRLMPGRRWSDGLHQAVEAKEGIKIERENQTLATITFQNYFRLYEKLSGMTGTAVTEEIEFKKIYDLDVTVVPTNKRVNRTNHPDSIYKNIKEKYAAVVNEIAELHKTGRPALVGTISIEKSERLSSLLKQKGVPHQVLNAKFHEMEAQIIAQAGRFKAVTIATNMAGRGTDIVLGGNPEYLAKNLAEEKNKDNKDEAERQATVQKFLEQLRKQCKEEHDKVVELGGLHVIGTERHESRRIDNQLRGRQGRQGDPGSSRFYVSLEDDLMRLFGPAMERVGGLMDKLGEAGEALEHPWLSKALENAQKRVEAHNFEIRKHLLEYDDVMNKQREVIYGMRRSVLDSQDVKYLIVEAVLETVNGMVNQCLAPAAEDSQPDLEGFVIYLKSKFGYEFNIAKEQLAGMTKEEVFDRISEDLKKLYDEREKEFGAEAMRHLERMLLLNTIDAKWKDHLYAMDQLKEGVGLRSYGQRNPLIEYKKEGFEMFQMMYGSINQEVAEIIFRIQPINQELHRPRGVFSALPKKLVHDEISGMSHMASQQPPMQDMSPQRGAPPSAQKPREAEPVRNTGPKVGRNDPCPCGSGKKYKKCCGA